MRGAKKRYEAKQESWRNGILQLIQAMSHRRLFLPHWTTVVAVMCRGQRCHEAHKTSGGGGGCFSTTSSDVYSWIDAVPQPARTSTVPTSLSLWPLCLSARQASYTSCVPDEVSSERTVWRPTDPHTCCLVCQTPSILAQKQARVTGKDINWLFRLLLSQLLLILV